VTERRTPDLLVIMPDAVRLAVVASVRHEDARYDELLMAGVPRQQARDRVLASIDSVLSAGRSASTRPVGDRGLPAPDPDVHRTGSGRSVAPHPVTR
jgi:hypothetical protein